MATKGGLSKQLKKKLPPPQRVPVVINLQRTETHAGLPRQIYTDLHYIPSPSRLFKTEKDDLAAQISSLTRKRDRIQAAFDAASNVAGKFQTNSRDYTDLLLVLDTLSASLTEACQSLTKLEEALASRTASEKLAYNLQLAEVDAHLQFVGRLDQPRPQWSEEQPEVRPPTRRGLSERSVNVPSPQRVQRRQAVRHQQYEPVAGPSRPLRQLVIDRFLTQQTPPSSHDVAMLETPEPEIEYRRCTHLRLHRLDMSADRNVRRQLKLACKANCGNSTAELYTLWPPLPEGRVQVAQNVVALPDVELPNIPQTPEASLSLPSQANDDQALEEAANLNETVELHSSPAAEEINTSSSSIIEQIDGLRNDHILSLPTPPPSPSTSWPSPPMLWSGSPPSSGEPLPPVDNCLGTCLMCAPDTPDYLRPDNGDYESSLIKRLNAESFKQLDELKRVKRELFNSPASIPNESILEKSNPNDSK